MEDDLEVPMETTANQSKYTVHLCNFAFFPLIRVRVTNISEDYRDEN